MSALAMDKIIHSRDKELTKSLPVNLQDSFLEQKAFFARARSDNRLCILKMCCCHAVHGWGGTEPYYAGYEPRRGRGVAVGLILSCSLASQVMPASLI